MTPPWWLASATALFLGFVAIFQEQIRRYLFGPKLELWFDTRSLIDAHRTTMLTTYKAPNGKDMMGVSQAFWVRLRVANTGHSAAQGVRLVAQALWKRRDADGSPSRVVKFTPL